MISVVLADDHPMVCRGLRTVVETSKDFQVVGEARDGREAVRLVETLRPTLLILDLAIPGMSGLDVIRHLKRRKQATRIVVFSMHASEAYVLEALRSGADGYVLKDAGTGEIVEAMRRVAAGQRYLCPPLSERAIAAYLEKTAAAPMDPLASLTAREREALRLAAEGKNTREMALRMGISARTAETHRANLMEKLGLHNQTDLVRFALRHRVVSSD
jgi:DNA-binding NarL/FixJ family response regulator